MRNNTELSRYCQFSPSSEPAHISDTFLSKIWADFLGDLAGQTDGGVDDVVTVQDEDAEDEDALAGGEDDVESQHDLVDSSVGLERLCGRQVPDREAQLGYHGADQQEQQQRVTEHLGQLVTTTTSTIILIHSPATAQFAGRLKLCVAGGTLQLQQGIISTSWRKL